MRRFRILSPLCLRSHFSIRLSDATPCCDRILCFCVSVLLSAPVRTARWTRHNKVAGGHMQTAQATCFPHWVHCITFSPKSWMLISALNQEWLTCFIMFLILIIILINLTFKQTRLVLVRAQVLKSIETQAHAHTFSIQACWPKYPNEHTHMCPLAWSQSDRVLPPLRTDRTLTSQHLLAEDRGGHFGGKAAYFSLWTIVQERYEQSRRALEVGTSLII